MEKLVYYNELIILYKSFVNDKNIEIFKLYYGENLSMQEIAEYKNLTRSRIGAIIKQTEKKLDKLEKNCNLYKINSKLKACMVTEDNNLIKNEIKELLEGMYK